MARGKYPALRKRMREMGYSDYAIRKAVNKLYDLNNDYYDRRDNPPQIVVDTFPDAHFEERDRFGHSRYVQGEAYEELQEMPAGQIEAEHYNDFYDWWVDTFGEDTWEDRHEIYPTQE